MSEYIIAFDFESFGSIPTINGFSELGAIIANLESGEIISKFHEFANQTGFKADDECIKTFWKEKYPDLLKKCNDSKYNPYQVIDLFIKWILQVITDNNILNIYLITDCSTYDSGILKTFSLNDTLKITGCIKDIIDTTSFYLGISRQFMTNKIINENSFDLACKELNLPQFKSSIIADHNPVNDSIVIFEKFKYINDNLK